MALATGCTTCGRTGAAGAGLDTGGDVVPGEAQEALALAHKFVGDIAVWATNFRAPNEVDWDTLATEARRVKRIIEDALSDSEETE